MHSDYNDWERDIPRSVSRLENRCEDQYDNLPVTQRMWCDGCFKQTLHTDLPGGGFECMPCGAQKVR